MTPTSTMLLPQNWPEALDSWTGQDIGVQDESLDRSSMTGSKVASIILTEPDNDYMVVFTKQCQLCGCSGDSVFEWNLGIPTEVWMWNTLAIWCCDCGDMTALTRLLGFEKAGSLQQNVVQQVWVKIPRLSIPGLFLLRASSAWFHVCSAAQCNSWLGNGLLLHVYQWMSEPRWAGRQWQHVGRYELHVLGWHVIKFHGNLTGWCALKFCPCLGIGHGTLRWYSSVIILAAQIYAKPQTSSDDTPVICADHVMQTEVWDM